MYFQLIACVLKFCPHFPAPQAVALSEGQKYLLEVSRKWYKEWTDVVATHTEKSIAGNIIKGSNN